MTAGLDSPVATGTAALITPILIQALKNSGWATWFNRETDKANFFLSAVVALSVTLGIHFSVDPSGNFAITGNIHLIGNAIVQWAAQHSTYKLFIVPAETLGEIRALLQRNNPPPISTAEKKVEEQTHA